MIPWWLKTWVLVLLALTVGGLAVPPACGSSFLGTIADAALIITLAVLSVYTYFTYVLARDASAVSASFALVPLPDDPYHFAFQLRNHGKTPLRCWCKLNPKVYGQIVVLGGFYGGQTSVDLQPFAVANGFFHVDRDILAKVGRTMEEMKTRASAVSPREQLYLDIEFWYEPYGGRQITRNPNQPHYIDFSHDALVADF